MNQFDHLRYLAHFIDVQKEPLWAQYWPLRDTTGRVQVLEQRWPTFTNGFFQVDLYPVWDQPPWPEVVWPQLGTGGQWWVQVGSHWWKRLQSCNVGVCDVLPEPRDISLKVAEDSEVVLNCSGDGSVRGQLFDWKKDQNVEVFIYDNGGIYGPGKSGQSPQFVGRVVHFPEALDSGNASIKISKAELSDSGNYECLFPRSPPVVRSRISLLVGEFLHKTHLKMFPQMRLVQLLLSAGQQVSWHVCSRPWHLRKFLIQGCDLSSPETHIPSSDWLRLVTCVFLVRPRPLPNREGQNTGQRTTKKRGDLNLRFQMRAKVNSDINQSDLWNMCQVVIDSPI